VGGAADAGGRDGGGDGVRTWEWDCDGWEDWVRVCDGGFGTGLKKAVIDPFFDESLFNILSFSSLQGGVSFDAEP
jgi:hypothetical protein